jgi:hypothetical protein
MPMVVSAIAMPSITLKNKRGTKTVSKPALTVPRPLRYCHPGRLLLAVREQPDTGVMAGKGRFIKALAGGADVRGPLKTTANVGYWLPGLDSNQRPFD